MQNYGALYDLPLFFGVRNAEKAIRALDAREKTYQRGERILSWGERCNSVGVVLSGSVDIVKEDLLGNPVTVARVKEGEMFAEAFAFSGEALSVSVVAASVTHVLWLRAEKISENKDLAAGALKLFAQKNIFLTSRIEHLSRRTLAEKALSYLKSERAAAGKNTFRVPFDRQGMADYLGCDRSALSAVLSSLKKRGVIDYHKNIFRFTQ